MRVLARLAFVVIKTVVKHQELPVVFVYISWHFIMNCLKVPPTLVDAVSYMQEKTRLMMNDVAAKKSER